jgi:titin
MASQPFAGGISAMTMADGRLVVNGGPPGTVSTPQRPRALTLDGQLTSWDSGVERALIGGTRDTFLVAGDLLVAGGIFGRRAAPALQGLAVFPLDGAKAPANLRARPRGAVTQFTWDAPVASPAGYVIEAGLTPGQTIGTFPLGNVSSFNIAVPAGSYYVRVRTAGAASGPEEVTNEILVTGGCTAAPAAPTNLVSAVNGAALSFSWTAPDALVNSYTLSAGSAPGLHNIATVPLGGELTSIAGLVPPGTYFVRLSAANACGASGPSGEVVVTVGAPDPLPAAPTNVTATVSGSAVTLAWTPPPGPVTGYMLEGGNDVGLANIGTARVGAVTSVAIPGAPPGVYVLRVRAITSAGTGAASADVVARVP